MLTIAFFAASTILLSYGYNRQASRFWTHNGINEVLYINIEENEIYAVTFDKRLIVIDSKTGENREIVEGQGKDLLKLGVHPISKIIYMMKLKGPEPGVVFVDKSGKTHKVYYDLDWDTTPIATVPDFVFADDYMYFSAAGSRL